MPKFAIYTAIIDNYDTQANLKLGQPIEGVDYFCYSDVPLDLPNFVTQRIWQRKYKDATRDAREIKVQAFQNFKEYDWVIWIDANCSMNAAELIRYLINESDATCPIKTFTHDVRNCAYDEAFWAFTKAADSPAIISHQINGYNAEGFPANFGLANTNLVIRKPTDATAIRFSEAWLQQIKKGSRRDQLSFDYVRWKEDITVETIPGIWYNNRFCRRTASHSKDANKPEFRLRMMIEWFKRILKARKLFHEVIYDVSSLEQHRHTEA
jgi:hypothetical protein